MSKCNISNSAALKQVISYLKSNGVTLPQGSSYLEAAVALNSLKGKSVDFMPRGAAKGFVINFGRGLVKKAEKQKVADAHSAARKAAKSAAKKSVRRPPRDKFYQSAEWKRVRYEALKRSHGRCECCGVTPAMGAVLNVDHIHPFHRRPDLALDLSNLQVLCGSCNQGKGGWDATDWRADRSRFPKNELDREFEAIMANC